jgi:endonuclease-3
MTTPDPAKVRRVYRTLVRTYPEAACSLRHGDPLQLLVATVLSAQCTDRQVNRVTPALFRQFKTVRDFAEADLRALERAIHATGFFRSKARHIRDASRRIREAYGGNVPDRMEDLLTLPGVGRKTANCVLGNAFGKPALVVDTHVIRISNRLGWVATRDPVIIEDEMMALLPRRDWTNFAHVLIAHGRAICRAKAPLCGDCPVEKNCPSSILKFSKSDKENKS